MDGDEKPERKSALAIILGLSLVLLAWIGLFSAGVPTLYCPMPTMTTVPAFLLLDRLEKSGLAPLKFETAVALIPAILFFLWNPGLTIRQQSNIPKRTVGLAGLLSIPEIVDFTLEWKYGLRYEGTHHHRPLHH